MTDRIKGLTVTLDPDIRVDAARPLIDAILMIKGVCSVDTHVVDLDHHMAVETAKREMRERLLRVLYGEQK